MPKDGVEGGSGDAGRSRAPRHSEQRRTEEARQRERLRHAAIEIAGEHGYRGVTVALICEHAELSRNTFYRHFSNRSECYLEGYERAVEELSDCILSSGRTGPSWEEGFAAALEELAEFAIAGPSVAAGALTQVYAAGSAAMSKRAEVSERLSHAVDSARRETSSSRHSPPPIAAAFIVSAIEAAVVGSLVRGAPEEFAAAVPELVRIAGAIYFSG